MRLAVLLILFVLAGLAPAAAQPGPPPEPATLYLNLNLLDVRAGVMRPTS